jgi:hypothetical protein
MEGFRVDRLSDYANLGSLDARGGEGLAVKFAWEPQLVQCVATVGPAVGDAIGAEGGAPDAATALKIEIPTRGRTGLVENAGGEVEPIMQ